MLQTPQASPPAEPRIVEPAPSAPSGPAAGSQGPYPYVPGYPAGYAPRYPVAPATQASYLTPTGGQRLGLAIASLALLIPLLAIATNVMTELMPYVPAGVSIAIGLITCALVCVTVVVVNLFFNWDMIGHKR